MRLPTSAPSLLSLLLLTALPLVGLHAGDAPAPAPTTPPPATTPPAPMPPHPMPRMMPGPGMPGHLDFTLRLVALDASGAPTEEGQKTIDDMIAEGWRPASICTISATPPVSIAVSFSKMVYPPRPMMNRPMQQPMGAPAPVGPAPAPAPTSATPPPPAPVPGK